MKKLIFMLTATLTFGLASAQIQKPTSNDPQRTTTENKMDKKDKAKQKDISGSQSNKMQTATTAKKPLNTKTAPTNAPANTPTGSNSVNYPSSPNGTENPGTVQTSPGSGASPTPTGTNPTGNPNN